MKKNTPTIRDVAAAAKVSTATVSKFVNGAQRFSPVVEATLKRVIDELGYRTNPLAQSMITGRTRTVGLSVLDVTNPHFTSFVKGANRVAMHHGYTLLLVDTQENIDRERQILEALSGRVDGMIVFSRMPEDELDWLVQLGKPLVFFGALKQTVLPTVAGDDHRGGYMVTRHLVTQGHRKIGYMGFSKSRRDEERLGGVRECLASYGLDVTVYDALAPTAAEGERLCSTIMLGADHPDALVCYNDLMAMGFIKAAQSLGFRLPEEISVAGFDNIQYGNFTSPALTSVDLQSERMGEVAMQKVLDIIDGKPTENLTRIDAQLVLRASTARRAEAQAA